MKQNKIIKIAITGGIGSGKSTVCEIIKKIGYPVYSCDEEYRELIGNGTLLAELVEEFGQKILNVDATLNRRILSEIVFGNEEKLKRLNSITHGKIFNSMFDKAGKYSGLVFFEVPILFEGGYQKLFNKIIVVERSTEKRIESVILRDGLNENEVKKRLNSQIDYDNYDFTKYYVIHNTTNITNLRDKVLNIITKINKLYSL